MKTRWWLHGIGVAILATLVCALFLREPGFGDDFTYWSFAFDLHEQGLKAWSEQSFHDLRWPVWGVSWLLQAISGPGLGSYYGVPLLYLILGALLAFTFGRLVTRSVPISWACAFAFLFHPLLDTVCYRPMPDLSEGVLGAAAVLTWWKLTQARTRAGSAAWAALLGALIYIVESNRLTGVFIVPVLLICTLLYARRSFGWLVVAGLVAAALYVGEAAFYHHLFGDWMHNLKANMGAKGRKGTESIAIWSLPFRFLDTLSKENPLAPFYCLGTVLGVYALWRRGGTSWRSNSSDMSAAEDLHALRPAPPLGKVLVVWFVTLYLEYSCAPQSLLPYRPLIRDADRFLAGLAVPFSVLAVLGFFWLLQLPLLRRQRWFRWLEDRPAIAASVVVALMILFTSRQLFNAGSVPELRRYIESRPAGTKVFTHDLMRAYAFLVDPAASRRLTWLYRSQILHKKPDLEALAAQANEFWYIRKLVWLTTRKQLERKNVSAQQPLASYFAEPEKEWTMTRLLAKGDTPDLIFYRRRTAETPPPRILNAGSPELAGLIPALPAEWAGAKTDRVVERTWQIPESLRGQLCRVDLEAASEKVEALTARLQFMSGRKVVAEYLLKPYLHPEAGREFFAFQIPAGADRCVIDLKLSKNTPSVRFTEFRAVIEKPTE